MTVQCFTWNNADFTWNDNPYTWNEVCLALELQAARGGGGVDDSNTWTKEKKQRYIQLYYKVKSQTEPFYDLRPESDGGVRAIKDIKVTAENTSLIITSVLKITAEI